MFGFDSPALLSIVGDGNLSLVDTLIEFGADPNRRSSWWAGGFHPLHAADGAVADRLIAAGSEPDACAAARLDRLEAETIPAHMQSIREIARSFLEEEIARVSQQKPSWQTPARDSIPE